MKPPTPRKVDRSMTYVSGFHCSEGIVLCTDTQETVGDQKRDAEKLYVSDIYPIAIGAAGIDEAIDAFAQELIALTEQQRPVTTAALKVAIQAALKEVHEHDAAASDYPAQY